jgi:hypothetical protein
MKILIFVLTFISVCSSNSEAAVNLVDIPAAPWPSSAVPGFAKRVCSTEVKKIKDYLVNTSMPFQTDLVTNVGETYCHLYYQPSAPGFRAKADFGSAHSLVINVPPIPLTLGRSRIWGDSFDIFRTLEKVRPDIRKIVLVESKQGLRPSANEILLSSEPLDWTQDFLVTGGSPNSSRSTLIPHRIFEGNLEMGERFAPFLNEMIQKFPVPSARSKISWEGGDLVVLQKPGTQETVLVYGDGVFSYWARDLKREEVEFILKSELGVDHIIDGSSLSSHVDYSILPIDQDRVLLRTPFTRNIRFTCDLVDVMLEDFERNLKLSPQKLGELKAAICAPNARFGSDILHLIQQAKDEFVQNEQNWIVNKSLDEFKDEMLTKIGEYCDLNDSSCIQNLIETPDGLSKLTHSNPRLAEAMLNSMVDGNSNRQRFAAYYDLLEGQTLTMSVGGIQRLLSVRRKLEEMGYKIINVPSPYHESGWAGLSYVNSLAVEKDLFLPSIGLRSFESALKSKLESDLGDFKVHLIPSKIQVLKNGGIHCTVKAIR